MSGDPFGRSSKDDEYDAFGNKVERREEDSLFHDPVPQSQPGEAPAGPFLPPEPPGGAPSEGSSGWAPPPAGGSSSWAPPSGAALPPPAAPAPAPAPAPPEPEPEPEPAGVADPAPPTPAPAPSGFLPPTDAAPAPSAWQAPPAPPAPPRTADEPSWWSQHPSGQPTAVASVDWGQRAGAAVVDFFVRLVIAAIPALIGLALAGVDGLVIGAYAGGAIGLAYAPIMIARTNGQTVGHRAVGTRIVRSDGSRLSGGNAALREVVVKSFVIEGLGGTFSLFIVPLVNYLWPLWDDKNEALHDKICSTKVVEA